VEEAERFIFYHPLDDHAPTVGWSSTNWCMIVQRMVEDVYI